MDLLSGSRGGKYAEGGCVCIVGKIALSYADAFGVPSTYDWGKLGFKDKEMEGS